MHRIVRGLFAVGLLLLAAPASAQQVDTQDFQPALGPHALFQTEGARTLGHLEPAGALLLDYDSRPLVFTSKAADGSTVETPVVDQQLALHVEAGIGLFDRLQLDFGLPVYLVNEGEYPSKFNLTDAGDLRLRAKGRLFGKDEGPGVALAVDVTAPTGDGKHHVGSATMTANPKAIFDVVHGPLLVAVNVGALFREAGTFGGNINLGPALTAGLGAELQLMRGLLRLTGDVWGRTALNDPFSAEDTPMEGLLGAKIVTTDGLAVTGAAGGSIGTGWGAPAFRMILGVGWAPRNDDFDGDGIANADDSCPELAEDLDGFQDTDGCPDPDNDGDAIPDKSDRCPNKPEDHDGFQDDDGCPDLDNDQDGVPDDRDQCRNQAEDHDGFQDDDGCPDLDDDGDGINDAQDKCPRVAEDFDGFQDDDGCPEPDNDGDGIPDGDDACPNRAGLPEDKGCPPAQTKAVREKAEIKILDKVYFETGSATIKPESFDLLNQVALVLKTNPDVKLVEIGGHTDRRGNDKKNMALSQARANSVRDYLIKRGTDPKRLTAVGYGETQPVDKSHTRAAMAKNRRVEFKILKQGSEAPTSAPTEEAPSESSKEPNAGPATAPTDARPAPARPKGDDVESAPPKK